MTPMSPPSDPIAELHGAIEDAARALRDGEPTGPEPSLERPPKPELGDYSSNAAMLLAAPLGEKPRDVAERLRGELRGSLGDGVERIEVAGPGFVNLFMSDSWHRRAMAALASAEEIGHSQANSPERVMVEFVSANPTGPLHVGGGRHAAYGDSIVRLLEATGHQVWREFYVNDAGGQIDRFAASIAARMTGRDPPEDGYNGEYVVDLAAHIREEGVAPTDTESLKRRGVELMIEAVRATLDRFGVSFNGWFSERDLYERGEVEAALEELRERGHSYESDGALWLRTTDFGDDKDRVLIRAGGEPTYLAADVAYHWDKLERGYGRLIDVLGADHHGYVPRLRAAIEALGADPGHFEALIMRLVHIVEGGERAQMSKRSGDFVSLDELIDDIGVDAARWFMLWRSHDTTVDLDLELARRQSNDNPVYYVQYAHARITGILRKAGDGAERAAADAALGGADGAHRTGAGQATAGVPRRGARSRVSPRPAQDLHLLDGGRRRLSCLLSRLPGCRGRRGGSRGSAPRPLPADEADDCRRAGIAWNLGARADVMRRGRRAPPVLAAISAARSPGDARAWRLRRADYEALDSLSRALHGSGVVLFTGVEEGKSAAAIGLATVATAAGGRVAVLECDLARPRLAGELVLSAAPGLCEYLRNEASAPQILQPLVLAGPASGAAVAPLTCIAAGAPTSAGAALLASEDFSHAISKLRNAYDLLVIDGPPLGRDEDALAEVAKRVDVTLACVEGVKAPRKLPVPVTGLVSLGG